MSIPGRTVRYELQGQYMCNGDKRWTTLSTHTSDDHALKAAKAVDHSGYTALRIQTIITEKLSKKRLKNDKT